MDNNALLYYFSTLAQCLAALAALPAVFIHFRTQALIRLMVGLGKSMLLRWDREPDYVQRYVPTLGSRRLLDRLKLEAAVEREDLKIVHRMLRRFAEVQKNIPQKEGNHGFAEACLHFESLNRTRIGLRDGLLWSVVFALLGMGLSLLGIMVLSVKSNCWVPLLMGLTAIIGSATLILVGRLVHVGMADPEEWDIGLEHDKV
ncbi:MAG: hypothetical protein IPI81_04945 [Flavobacteriales bacterium]|nr:hypothetical protein [Flavobacteriales bacterium]MCC6939837.1 hypothetical protein [Flavobacteriales bacterium]